MNLTLIVGSRKGRSNLPKATALALVLALVLALTSVRAPAGAAALPPGCDVTVPAGADNLPESPAGNTTYCLRGGVHTESDKEWRVSKPGVQIKSYPGETAEMRGSIRTFDTGTGFTLGQPGTAWPNTQGGVRVDASYGVQKEPNYGTCPFGCDRYSTRGLHMDADGFVLAGNEVRNRRPNGGTALAGMGVYVTGGSDGQNRGGVIDGNWIDDAGQIPRNNHEHAIYVARGTGLKITGNLITDSADRNIQLYPNADSTTISGNAILGASVGITLDVDSAQNAVRNNVVANAASNNIQAGPTLSGTGNVAVDNCVWKPGGSSGLSPGPGLSITRSVVADPRLDGTWNDGAVKVTNPTCAAKLPAGSRFRP